MTEALSIYRSLVSRREVLQAEKAGLEIDLKQATLHPEFYNEATLAQLRERYPAVNQQRTQVAREIDSLLADFPSLRETLEREERHLTDGAAEDEVGLGEQKEQSTAVITRLSDVTPLPVRWLWRGLVPLGKVTVLDGDPGLGKSMLSLDLAARVSTARLMPDGTRGDLNEPAGVVLFSAEDDPADTVRPRLEAAGATLSRIVSLIAIKTADESRLPTLADLEEICAAIQRVKARLLIIDPLMAYLPSKVDSYRDQDIRRSLAPLAALAAKTGVAALVIRHLNKTEGKNALYRGGGSIGIVGAARSGLLVAKDPDNLDGETRILVSTKCNLAKLPPALAYHIEATADEVPFLVWEGATAHTAAALLAQPADGEDRSALEEAMDFLREVLADGPRPAKKVQREAEQADIAERTLRRARVALGIKPTKHGHPGDKEQQWFWSLPPKMAKGAEDVHQKSMATFGEDGHLRDTEAERKEEAGNDSSPGGVVCRSCRQRSCVQTPWGWLCRLSEEDQQRWQARQAQSAQGREASELWEEDL